ncbi:hypothetical protein M422DRAFT_153476 [Sphaerobolus stellatus SS14]|nr:hypothetical protein M422DRAFT_153476 [Sphaerobolus stellatus SS14]
MTLIVIASTQYVSDNEHWAGSSSQPSGCSVEPSTPGDAATIFGIIQKTRATWAVKSGGHAYNPGFSSTDGVLIALSRFNEIDYHPASSTVKVGAGNLWDDVYAKLVPLGVNVVGGRVPGVGVAGFTLDGGYSWKTQNYGLALDNVVSYELITPTAQILNVSAQSHPDLFFGLKGGGNYVGIVTAFVLKTHPQGLIYAGSLFYAVDIPIVRQGIADFDANDNDPNALILPTYISQGGNVSLNLFAYYEGPIAPDGIFDAFLNVNALTKDVETRSFLDFQQSIGIIPPLPRSFIFSFHLLVPIIRYTKSIVDAIVDQSILLGIPGFTDGVAEITIEPFLSDLYDHSTGGAYPHSPAHPWTPCNVFVSYSDLAADDRAFAAVNKVSSIIQQLAIEEGQSSPDAILYNNYAGKGRDLKLLFGDNLPLLRVLRAKYDPHNLLNLTGGWRFRVENIAVIVVNIISYMYCESEITRWRA